MKTIIVNNDVIQLHLHLLYIHLSQGMRQILSTLITGYETDPIYTYHRV